VSLNNAQQWLTGRHLSLYALLPLKADANGKGLSGMHMNSKCSNIVIYFP
jgi:hypothetical protein